MVQDVKMNKFNSVKYHDIMIIIKELLEEAYEMLPAGEISDEAHAFWYCDMMQAIDDDHCFEGRSRVTMSDSYDAVNCKVTSKGEMEDNPANKEKGFSDD